MLLRMLLLLPMSVVFLTYWDLFLVIIHLLWLLFVMTGIQCKLEIRSFLFPCRICQQFVCILIFSLCEFQVIYWRNVTLLKGAIFCLHIFFYVIIVKSVFTFTVVILGKVVDGLLVMRKIEVLLSLCVHCMFICTVLWVCLKCVHILEFPERRKERAK